MINLGPTFETAVANAIGINPATFDPGSLQIDLINPAGPTTVRYTIAYTIDTPTLQALVKGTLPA